MNKITCVIPRTGRTFENFLAKLKLLGVDKQEINKILEISKQSKAMSRTNFQEASEFLIKSFTRDVVFWSVYRSKT